MNAMSHLVWDQERHVLRRHDPRPDSIQDVVRTPEMQTSRFIDWMCGRGLQGSGGKSDANAKKG